MSEGSEELRALSADFRKATDKTLDNTKRALMFTAGNIKKQWAATAGGGEGFVKKLPLAIDYDVRENQMFGGASIEVEIGPNLRKPGGTAGFREDAPGDVRSAPQFAGRDAVEANEADFMKGLLIAGLEPLEG